MNGFDTQASGENAIASGQGLFGATNMVVAAITAAAAGILYETTGAAGLWWIAAMSMIFFLIIAWWRGSELRDGYAGDTSQLSN